MKVRYWIFLVSLLTVVSGVNATTVILTPTDDTYVYNNSSDTNYGNDIALSSGYTFDLSATHFWTTFLKFNLSGVPTDQTVVSATLHMYQYNGAGYSSSGTNAAYVADDSWTAASVTWNSRPAYGDVLGSCLDDKSHRDWSQWNLLSSSAWDWSIDLIDGVLSLAIMESGGSSTHNWYSTEFQQTLTPYLELTYVPEPCTLILVGLGGLLLRRRHAA